VSGGAGFLGSHLCEHLLADGAVVICVDNFFTGARRNIEHLLADKHFDSLDRIMLIMDRRSRTCEVVNLIYFHIERDPLSDLSSTRSPTRAGVKRDVLRRYTRILPHALTPRSKCNLLLPDLACIDSLSLRGRNYEVWP